MTRGSLGIALSLFEFDLEGARRELESAIGMDGGYSAAHQWLSAVLMKIGDWDGCLREVDLAYESDRTGYTALRAKSAMRYFLRDYQGAMAGFLEVDRLNPGLRATTEYLGECSARLGLVEPARRYAEEALRLAKRNARACAYASVAYTLSGDRLKGGEMAEEAAGKFAAREYFQPTHLVRAFAELGDLGRAFGYLEECVRVRDTGLPMVAVHQSFDALRKDSRYSRLIKRAAINYGNGRGPDVGTLTRRRARG